MKTKHLEWEEIWENGTKTPLEFEVVAGAQNRGMTKISGIRKKRF